MSSEIQTFGHWLRVYCCDSSSDAEKKAAMKMLVELADDPRDSDIKNKDCLKLSRWQMIHSICPQDSSAKKAKDLGRKLSAVKK